ncbi:MAG TPA: hypothetical protein VHX88_11000 [Solirubrobacteraceae bacterium]|jgi:hypothetical protein|nr:hypothetical protein [Solirubrobacteraceae bacterium]
MRIRSSSSLLAAAVLTVGAACALPAFAAGSKKISNCNEAQTRPKDVTIACGDGNTFLANLHWSSFGGSTASATGTFEENNCSPSCVNGKLEKAAVKVIASGTIACKGRVDVYQRVSLVYTSKQPAQARKRYSLFCPS